MLSVVFLALIAWKRANGAPPEVVAEASARCIYIYAPPVGENEPGSSGSGVLVRFGNRVYVLTAAHVLVRARKGIRERRDYELSYACWGAEYALDDLVSWRFPLDRGAFDIDRSMRSDHALIPIVPPASISPLRLKSYTAPVDETNIGEKVLMVSNHADKRCQTTLGRLIGTLRRSETTEQFQRRVANGGVLINMREASTIVKAWEELVKDEIRGLGRGRTDKLLLFSRHFGAPGSSGAGVYNLQGELIALYVGSIGEFGLGIPIGAILSEIGEPYVRKPAERNPDKSDAKELVTDKNGVSKCTNSLGVESLQETLDRGEFKIRKLDSRYYVRTIPARLTESEKSEVLRITRPELDLIRLSESPTSNTLVFLQFPDHSPYSGFRIARSVDAKSAEAPVVMLEPGHVLLVDKTLPGWSATGRLRFVDNQGGLHEFTYGDEY